jgi:hypothetical protein
MDRSGSGQGVAEGFCESCSEHGCAIKYREFLDHLRKILPSQGLLLNVVRPRNTKPLHLLSAHANSE